MYAQGAQSCVGRPQLVELHIGLSAGVSESGVSKPVPVEMGCPNNNLAMGGEVPKHRLRVRKARARVQWHLPGGQRGRARRES